MSSCSGRVSRGRLFLASARGILPWDAPICDTLSVHRRTSNAVTTVSASGGLTEPFVYPASPRQQVLHAKVILLIFQSLLSVITDLDVWPRTRTASSIGIYRPLMYPCWSLYQTTTFNFLRRPSSLLVVALL